MKIRIGIVTRNRAGILPKAIDSALRQRWPDKEVWVIDDASTDSTPELAASYPEVRWIRNNTVLGYREGRNRMMQAPGADFFCSLDDDSWFLENDALDRAMEVFDSRPDVAGIGFDILDEGNSRRQGRGCIDPAYTFIGCGHLLRLDAVKEAGYYSPIPGCYGVEEKDLSLKFLDLGHDVVCLTGVHVWHDKAMLARDVGAQHRSGVCNDLVFTARRAPLDRMPLLVVGKVLRHAAFASSFGLHRSSKRTLFERQVVEEIGRFGFIAPTIKGFVDFVLTLPSTIKSREPVAAKAWNSYRSRGRRRPAHVPADEPDRVSVIITTRNRHRQLSDTLDKIMSCEPPPDEVLVCCDGCSDESVPMLKRDFPQVDVIENSSWTGSIPSRDRLIRAASNEVVVSLDDDSYPMDPGFFGKVCRICTRHPRAAVLTFPQVTDEFPDTLTQIRPTQGERSLVGTFTNSGAVIRRSIYLDLPGFAVLFEHAYEEPDFAQQCIGAGYRIIHEPSLTVRHLYSRVERNERRTHQFHSRNEICSALMRAPLWLLPMLISYRILRQAHYALGRGWRWVLLEPRWWIGALRRLPRAWKSRRPLAASDYLRWLSLLRNPEPAPPPPIEDQAATMPSRGGSPRDPED